jgi:hypothetical protein
MMKALILAAAILAQAVSPANALEQPPVPVQEGGNYILWYDAPANRFAGLKERRTFVRVLEIRGNWIRADQFFSDRLAGAMAMVEEIEKDSEVGKSMLAKMGKNKEEFLKEVKANPIPEDQHIEVWINLQRIEAITKHNLNPKKAEQGGAGQPATRPEPKSEGGDKPQPESEGRSR